MDGSNFEKIADASVIDETVGGSLEEYKTFIDKLVEMVNNHSAIAEPVDYSVPLYARSSNAERERFGKVFASLSTAQREYIVEFLGNERIRFIDELLSYFSWKGYHLSRGPLPLAVEPFDAELAYDFGARLEGYKWPDE